MLAIGNHNNELADRLATGLTVRHPNPPPWATVGSGHGPFNYFGAGQGGSIGASVLGGQGGSTSGGSMSNYNSRSDRSSYSHFSNTVPMSPGPYSRSMENGLYNSYSSVGGGGSAHPQMGTPKPQSMHSELYSSSSSLRGGVSSTPQHVVRKQASTPQSVQMPRKSSDAGSHSRPSSRQSLSGSLPPQHQAPAPAKPGNSSSKPTTIVSAPRVMPARKDSYSGPVRKDSYSGSSSASFPRQVNSAAPVPAPAARTYGDRSSVLSQSRSVTPPNAPISQHDVGPPVPRRSNSPPVRSASPPGRPSPPARLPMPARRSPPSQQHPSSSSSSSSFGVQRKLPIDEPPAPPARVRHEMVQEVGYLC